MHRLIPFTEGQRMALLDILGAYIRLANLPSARNDELPTEFINASDGTECNAEELLVKLMDPPVAGFVAQELETGAYCFRDSRGDLWGLETTGDHIGPFKVRLLERRR